MAQRQGDIKIKNEKCKIKNYNSKVKISNSIDSGGSGVGGVGVVV